MIFYGVSYSAYTVLLGVLIRPCMRVKNCPVLFEKFPKVQLEKKRGGDSAPGCRASKLLDFRPLLHLFLEALNTLHALSYMQWPVYSNRQFSFALRVGRKRAKTL